MAACLCKELSKGGVQSAVLRVFLVHKGPHEHQGLGSSLLAALQDFVQGSVGQVCAGCVWPSSNNNSAGLSPA